MYEKRRPESTWQNGLGEKNGSKIKKNQFYMDQNHFEASQCPQVLGSAQNGEEIPGPKPYPGVIRRAGQCAGGY